MRTPKIHYAPRASHAAVNKSLPIFSARASLETAWQVGKPIVLSAPTGSGKSTCVPLWLAEAELLKSAAVDSDKIVLVVEPRRVACRALAMYLSRLRGEPVGKHVGYAVRFDKQHGTSTRVLFVTPGVALGMLAQGELAKRCHTLMLDEFHERSAEVDLLAARAQLLCKPGGVRLLLCSATLDSEVLAKKIGGCVVHSSGRSFDVEIRYQEEGGPSDDNLESRVSQAVTKALAQCEGDVLVFLPGRGEIRRCRGQLEGSLRSSSARVELVEVHGGVSPERLAKAFAAGSGRRVYLSTNVAESSVTLPGVRCVIDSGLARRIVHRAGCSLLALSTIAQDAADQRAGRAGRVVEGECWRLWGRGFRLEPLTPPEVECIELDDFVLRAATMGLQAKEFDEAPWISLPPAFAVERARARLVACGVLDEGLCLSERGKAFGRLPVSAARAGLLLDAPPALRADLADLIARLEVDRSLVRAPAKSRSAQDARALLFAHARDEVELELAVLRGGDAQLHELDVRTLRETRRVAMALRESIGASPKDPTKSNPILVNRDALVAHVLAHAPQLAFAPRPRDAKKKSDRGGRAKATAWANDEGTELALYPYRLPKADDDTHGQESGRSEAALIFGARWLGVGLRARGVGELALPIELSALQDAGLGTLEIGTARIIRTHGSISIEATSLWRFASVRREEKGGRLRGDALRKAAASLLAGGAMYPDLVSRLEEACLHRDMLESLPPFNEHPDPTGGRSGEAWLYFRLGELGLESGEDFELIGVDDLVPDLEARVRAHHADPSVLLQLRKDFPLDFVDRGARYRIKRADLQRRRVVIEPGNTTAKKRGEASVKFLPRYRGFSVVFEQASRQVKLR